MKKIVLTALFILISSACNRANQTPSLPVGNISELNKETLSGAVEFIVSSRIFVEKTSGDCKAILAKEDDYAKNIVDKWLLRNGREVRLSQKFLDNKIASILASEKKEDVSYAHAQIQNKLQTNALSMEAAVFALARSKKYTDKTACYDFMNGLRLGMYDLKELLKNYAEIVKLL